MSIAQELLDSENFLINAYDKLAKKGATMPEKKTLKNLADTIESLMGIEFVDYIESTGTQYIDTGYLMNANSEFVIDGFAVDGTLFGSGAQGKYMSAGILNIEDVYRARWRASSSANVDVASTIPCDTTRHSFKINKTSFYIDDVLIGNLNSTYNFTETGTTYIFGWNNGSAVANIPSLARIYSFKIYDNGTLVRDFKPCKDTRGEYCLYDAVSNRYFYNQGAGSFRGEGWQPTYIESTGTQHIDAGIKPNQNTKVECEFYIVKPSTGEFLYGARNAGAEAQFGCYINSAGEVEPRYGSTNMTKMAGVMSGNNVIIQDKTTFTLNSKSQTGSEQEFTTNYNMQIFGVDTGGTVGSLCDSGTRIYYFKIYDDGSLVRDFVPSIDTSGVICLYDKVSETYFYNAGSGTFNCG